MQLQEALQHVLQGGVFTDSQACSLFQNALQESTEPMLMAGLLTALSQRGEKPQEITGAARALRAKMLPFEHHAEQAVDTCGTGGDGLGLFNFSTAAAIVACAAGAQVIKHGNRSLSSRCGSADLLEAVGLPLDLEPQQAARVLEEVGITFLFAPRYHPAMRFAGPVRKILGIRTIFNFLGPLCNPGRVRRHLLGVSDPQRVADFAEVLHGLEMQSALVVHSSDGADEMTLGTSNTCEPVGECPKLTWNVKHLGWTPRPVSHLVGGDAAQNLKLLNDVLKGKDGPLREALVLNSAATLIVAGVHLEQSDALAAAREALDGGAALRKLQDWVQIARSVQSGNPPRQIS